MSGPVPESSGFSQTTFDELLLPGPESEAEQEQEQEVEQEAEPVLPVALPFTVEVRRSARRRRTVGAQLRGSVLHIAIPSWMSAREEAQWVERMREKFERQRDAARFDLEARAAALARRYGLPRPASIRWAGDMKSRWGSCTIQTRTIRISDRLAAFPDWVLDYVIVHELAHLVVAAHDTAFWDLVHRYPKAERATGYLIAKSGEDSEHD